MLSEEPRRKEEKDEPIKQNPQVCANSLSTSRSVSLGTPIHRTTAQ